MDIQQQKSFKVLLLGDSCIDMYHFGTCDRISPEAPVPILKILNTETKFGMAENVKLNLLSFGIEVDFITNKEIIKKNRYIDIKSKNHLLRVDEGENTPLIPIKKEDILINKKYDAIVISDYNKGFLTEDFCHWVTNNFTEIPIIVDTKKKNLSCYNNCIIKLNKHEFSQLTCGNETSELIVTLGAEGALYKNVIYPTKEVEVHDVCGAGDVFLSVFTYYYLLTKDIKHSIINANKFSSLSVTKFGTYVLKEEDINGICI